MKTIWKIGSLVFLLTFAFGCAGPSKAELAKIQSSNDLLAKTLVEAYRNNDEKLFQKLVLPYEQLMAMIAALDLPPGADVAERMEVKKAKFKETSRTIFQLIVANYIAGFGEITFEGIDVQKSLVMDGGYQRDLLKLKLKTSKGIATQMVTFVKTPDNRIWLGDLLEFDPKLD